MTKLDTLKKQIGTEKEQLKDVTIIISSVETNEDPKDPSAYASTAIYHYDLEGDVDEFIAAVEALKQKSNPNGKQYPPNEYLIEGGHLKAQ